MTPRCWIDGMSVETLPATDRGLQYGDGLFETLALRTERIALLDYHLDRLKEGCERLGMAMPDRDLLRRELSTAAAGQRNAAMKLMLTRGSGGRGYRPPSEAKPRRILFLHPWPGYPAAWAQLGIRLRLCRTRLAHQPQLAGIKHLNRLEQVLARAEWNEADGFQEGLMLDLDGAVVEGTMSNVFASPREGVLITPDLSRCGVVGVMRRHLLESARRAGIDVQVRALGLPELQDCPEVFLSNSLMGVWPVAEFEGRPHTVGAMGRLARSWAEAA